MSDLPYSLIKISDLETSLDAPITQALFAKLGGSINYLLDKNFQAFAFTGAGSSLFVPPSGLTNAFILLVPAGGGGGSGGNGNTGDTAGAGASGGRGGVPHLIYSALTPGNSYTMTRGAGGNGGAKNTSGNGGDGNNGSPGGLTSITGTDLNVKIAGAAGGLKGFGANYAVPLGGFRYGQVPPYTEELDGGFLISSKSGKGGNLITSSINGEKGDDGGISLYNSIPAEGGGGHYSASGDQGGGGGGAGGNSLGTGGRGGHGGHVITSGMSTTNPLVRVANVTTIDFTNLGANYLNHWRFNIGDYIKVGGVNTSFNGRFQIIDKPSPYKVSYSNPGADASTAASGHVYTADNLITAYAAGNTYESCNGQDGILGSGGGGGGGGGAGYSNFTRGAKGGKGGDGAIYVIGLVTP